MKSGIRANAPDLCLLADFKVPSVDGKNFQNKVVVVLFRIGESW